MVFLGGLLFYFPLRGYGLEYRRDYLANTDPSRAPPLEESERVLWAIAGSNLLDAGVSLTLIVISFGLLIHKGLWPTAERVLYKISPSTVWKRLLIVVGMALLPIGIGRPITELAKGILDSF
jgi:hypothetical protein